MDNENQTPNDSNSGLPTSPLPANPESQPPQPPQPPQPSSNPAEPTSPTPAAPPVDTAKLIDYTPAPSGDEPEYTEPPSTLSTIASNFTSILGALFSWVIFPVAVVLILHNFVFQAYHVLGTSMVPTLHETDYLVISKVGYTQALVGRILGQNNKYIPSRGEIIVFRYPKDPTKVFVKRVIGLPGDHIVIKNGTVTIFNNSHPNGFSPDASYELKDAQTLIDTDEVVQNGNIFVMGDNRTPGGSYDSREWGELPSSYIIGNAVLRLLPLDQVRIF